MKYLMKMTKEAYHCYTDGAGDILERPIGTIGRRKLTKDKDDFLKKYVDLIMNTKIISETTKIYIRSTLPSVASVITDYNDMANELDKINIKTAQSKVDYDTKKLTKYFSDDMINNIIAGSSCNLKDYEKMLNLAVADFSKKNKILTDNLVLKIPRVEVRDICSDDQFSELLKIVLPYFKKSISYVESNLPESVGYLLFLMSTPVSNLTFEDKERLEIIKNII